MELAILLLVIAVSLIVGLICFPLNNFVDGLDAQGCLAWHA